MAAIPLAPPVGFEPTTLRLTAACSTCCAKEAKFKGLDLRQTLCVGVDLSFQSVSRQVLSALVSLTSVFGMGTGGPSPLKTPTIFRNCTLKTKQRRDKARGLPAKYRSSPRVISTSRLNTLLRLHRWPINEVVFFDPYSIMDGRSYLRGSFTLRCLQRLSRPDIATQLCRWHDNWCTRGLSIPVLSY